MYYNNKLSESVNPLPTKKLSWQKNTRSYVLHDITKKRFCTEIMLSKNIQISLFNVMKIKAKKIVHGSAAY